MTPTETELVSPTATSDIAPAAIPWLSEPESIHPGANSTITTDKTTCLRGLIHPGLFDKLTFRVMADNGQDQDTAERVVEQALAFLLACARYPNRHLSPSEAVDVGWHAFLLHTAEYAEFCHRVAGRFIHHRPDGPGEESSGQAAAGVTITAMRDAGLPVDANLWVPRSACSQCYQGCADDPKGA